MRSRNLIIPLICAPTLSMALPEGFVLKEFAAPPNVDYPAAISVTPSGDVYVSSDQNGSLGKDPNMGRVIRARDTDGDGVADEFIHFIPNVDSPRGSHFVGDTLYLIHPPYLSAYRDTNGDGVADEVKQLVTGLGGGIEHPRGADHTTNSVRMGIDGWLYICVGDFGAEAKGTDGSSYTLFGGGVLRVRPDGSQLEPYALMTRNIYGIAISPELDMFSRDNTNDGKGWNTRLLHFTELADFGYPRLYKNFADEAVAPLADYGGGSGTGAFWLQEPGFPNGFGNMLFTTDWGTGKIYYHPWQRQGASFEVKQEVFENLPAATGMDVDGFSRLYLADWRGGSFSFAGKGKPVGRISLVTAPGETPAKYTDVLKAKDADLVKLVGSKSSVQRFAAQREILKRGRKQVFADGLSAIYKSTSQEEPARVAAIFTLKQLYGSGANRHLAELAKDATVREHALRALADRAEELTGVSPDLYVGYLQDPNPRVVLQALIGLERLKAKGAAPAILAAAKTWPPETGVSPRLPHTAIAVLAALGNAEACLAAISDPAVRGIALGALQKLHRKDVVDGLIALAEATEDNDVRFDVLVSLGRLYHQEKPWNSYPDKPVYWWNTRPDDRGPYHDVVEWELTGPIRAAIEKGFAKVPQERRDALLGLLGKNRLPVTDLQFEGLDPVLAALDSAQLDPAQLMLLANAAKDPKRPFAQRVQCYKALSKAGENAAMPYRLAVLAGWSEEPDAPEEAQLHILDFVNSPNLSTQLDALREIAAKQSNAASAIAWRAMLSALRSPLTPPDAKQKVQGFIDAMPREVGFFLALIELNLSGYDKEIAAAQNWDNAELRKVAKEAQETLADAPKPPAGKKIAEMDPKEVAEIALKSQGKGDLEWGKRLYFSQACISCHAIDSRAEQKGPYLGSAASYTRQYVIESILEPYAVVAQGFPTTAFQMKDGSSKIGFITGESDGVVELRDMMGHVSTLHRADVVSDEHIPTSMMPGGLASLLTMEEFISLVDYVQSLKVKAQ